MQLIFAVALSLFVLSPVAAKDSPQHGASEGPSIGLPVAQKAPIFSARDQFGREQTNDTVKGSKGTVLVFFRSADW